MAIEKGVEKVAGYVEDYLEWAEEASLSDIVREIEAPNPVVLMGVGYLVSQNRVEYTGEDYKIRLIQK